MRLICVVFNCSDSNIRFTDTRTLFDWGFDNFKKITASSDTISSYFRVQIIISLLYTAAILKISV